MVVTVVRFIFTVLILFFFFLFRKYILVTKQPAASTASLMVLLLGRLYCCQRENLVTQTNRLWLAGIIFDLFECQVIVCH